MVLPSQARMDEKPVKREPRMTLEPSTGIGESYNSYSISFTYAVRRGFYLRHVQCRVGPAYTHRPIRVEHLFPTSERSDIPQKKPFDHTKTQGGRKLSSAGNSEGNIP
jgi:hypothetical protein